MSIAMRTELFVVIGALGAAILIISATLAWTFRMRAMERRIARMLARVEELSEERHRQPRQKWKPDETGQSKKDLRGELDSLRSLIGKIPGETVRQVRLVLPERQPEQPRLPAREGAGALAGRDRYEEPADGLAKLLVIANRIVQQSSTTLEEFRTSAGVSATRVAAYPSSGEGMPLAFIVEHRGAHYAVPNVVKPARLPQDWFNRSEFGINDEIQQIFSLPRLLRRGDRYDVQEAGVFGR
jgi:hypothetical protein